MKTEFAGADDKHPASAGLLALPLRLVLGWTFFSAFWRRVVLGSALDPHAHSYIGEKFNHFLPHALVIKPIIEHLVTHPATLAAAMTVFTIIEAAVGVCLMVGLFTRLMSLGVTILAFGILLGSGWLGSTCVDEWQIGILGVASGCTLFFLGGGPVSLDHAVCQHYPALAHRLWLSSGGLSINNIAVVTTAATVFLLALLTNQYFHGGLYGPLHNDSVKPELTASNVSIASNVLQFDLSRTAGPDTYGSFLIDIALVDQQTGRAAIDLDARTLSTLPSTDILNRHVVQIRTGKHSLEVPLGATARLRIPLGDKPLDPRGRYHLTLTDISDRQWTSEVAVSPE